MKTNNVIVNISNEELKLLQQKNLELLVFFRDYCEKHSLRFYLCGGSCIGAVRHGGFIPWDDDVDVFMPRPDFEKLCKNFNNDVNTDKYCFEKTTKEHYTRLQLACVCDETTTFVKQRQEDLNDVHHGVRIDVLPLDGCPDSKFKRKMQIFWALIYSMFIVGEPHTSKGKALEALSKIMLFFFRTKKSRYIIWRLAEKKMSKYDFDKCEKITELCAWYQYMVNEYPKSAFEQPLYLDFEGEKMPVPTDYDAYLKMAFGDYMKMPPENERIQKHDIVKFDMNKSYKEFFK